jgi:ribose 5-phosphate isomerase A
MTHDGPAPDPIEDAKRRVGEAAADLVEDGMRVGLGTGSTVHHTIVALGRRKADIVGVATSQRTADLAASLGIRIVGPDEAGHLDITIDGADEVDPAGNLTKGGGGAHTREKVVAQMADRFVVVVDESKLVPHLGPFGTPLEVLDFAPGVVSERLRALGAQRIDVREGRSDSGNVLLVAHFGEIPDPTALAGRLAAIPGVVEHGIFLAPTVERVLVAGVGGIRTIMITSPDAGGPTA